MKYVVLLRGINVGGKSLVKMEELRRMLEELGFTNVKTLLNSGNAVFEKNKTKDLASIIEVALKKTFGREISVIVRPHDQIQHLIDADPFKGIVVTPDTRLYVTFLSDLSDNEKRKNENITQEKYFQIVRITDTEVCSVITLSPTKNTTDLMGNLEKIFGKNITTRNWNTVVKIAELNL